MLIPAGQNLGSSQEQDDKAQKTSMDTGQYIQMQNNEEGKCNNPKQAGSLVS